MAIDDMVDDGWEPTSDYDDQMDALARGLLEYDDTHCRHGTFVGNWAGPDYMCGYCEMGVTDEEFEEGKRLEAERNEKRKAARQRWEEINREVETTTDKDATWATAVAFLDSEEGQWLYR